MIYANYDYKQMASLLFYVKSTYYLRLKIKVTFCIFFLFLFGIHISISCLQAKNKLEKSMVADNESGKSVLSQIRTSSGMFITKGQVNLILFSEQCLFLLENL